MPDGAPRAGLQPVRPAAARPLETVLAFDYGLRRTGVAVGQRLLGSARPLTTIDALGDARFGPIEKLVHEWQPQALVVGVPRHPDGAPHENTLRAQRFGRQLHGRFGLPVHEVDERYSTVEVLSQAREKPRGGRAAPDADAAAAALLLEQFFHELALKETSS
ncbi:MAG: Holliday junction resolvase RuvX [Burkholderiales bacterium]